jgi:DNA-binding transcriptional MerR regulator
VLEPAWIDPFSGYRSYAVEQLADARRIVLLRDAGFLVSQIAAILGSLDDPSSVSALLDAQRRRLDAERADVEAKVEALAYVTANFKEHLMSIDVSTTTIPAMTVAALRGTIPSYADEGMLWGQMAPLSEQSHAVPVPDGLAGATFYDEDFRESDVDVEVWMQVGTAFEASAPLTCREIPEQRVVTATLRGDYSQMSTVTSAIGAYIAEHELSTGPMFCIYKVSPAQDPRPENWVTEVCYPIV